MARKGSFLENIVRNSLYKINKNNKGFFIKSPTPNNRVYMNGNHSFIYSSKALCDFIGIYCNKFVLIECKEISGKFFEIKRLKDHQLKQLNKIQEHGGISYIFFYSKLENIIIILNINQYNDIVLNLKIKNIKLNELKENGFLITNFKKSIDIENIFSNH